MGAAMTAAHYSTVKFYISKHSHMAQVLELLHFDQSPLSDMKGVMAAEQMKKKN